MRSYSRAEDEEVGLAVPDRRRTNSHHGLGMRLPLDEAEEALIVATENHASKGERKQATRRLLRELAINALLIGLWYTFSLLISVYNKWMFAPDKLNFHFPLFVTSLHMVIQFSLATLVLYIFPQFRPPGLFSPRSSFGRAPVPPGTSESPNPSFRWGNQDEDYRKKERSSMTSWTYITKIGPCGAATGLDIGLGNMSLKFISLAFYTMCKSSSLAFVLLFAFLFGLEKVTWKLVIIIVVMTIGVVMMVASEAQFVLAGFFLVISASALSGVRWSLTQLLLVRNPATSNPFSSIFYLAPCMFLAILVIAIPVEGFSALVQGLLGLVEAKGLLGAVGIVLFPGLIAFLMVSSEFALLKRSSVVTLSICGIFKEVITISASAKIYNDPLTPINISGLCVTIGSIAAYNYIKITRMRKEAVEEAHRGSHTRANTGYEAVAGLDVDDDERARPIDEEVSNMNSASLELTTDENETILERATASPDLQTQSSDTSSSADYRSSLENSNGSLQV